MITFENQLFHTFDWFSLEIFSGNDVAAEDNKELVNQDSDWHSFEVIYLLQTSVGQSPGKSIDTAICL